VDADWRWRKELWTLNQTGNWSSHSVGDNSGGNNELAETGTFNTANEWTGRTRTTPSTSPTSDTLVYDKVGNMTESGKGEKYVYDGFGRLREVHDWVETAPSTWGWRIHTAYRYNGLGMRLTHEINVDNDADIDGSDVKTYFAYDERWRVVGTYDSPTAAGPTERWVHHAAGLAGSGSSSYIDSVVLRDRDVVLSGTGSSYGGDALEERVYVLQNWRADVVATLGRTGTLIEWIQYTPYGMAVTNPPGNADFNGDGGVDGGDTEAFFLAWEGGLPSADINNDGGVDTADVAAFEDIWEAGETPQAGLCMLTAIRVGYAGYQWDGSVNHDRTVSGAMAGLYHVRHRVYDPELGRWTRRDPAIELISITSSISYCENPIADADPMGEISIPAGASWSELEGPLDLFSDNAILLGSIGSGMEHFPVAGITSIDGAIESCMRHPTISQRVACLENLIDLFPGNQGFETMIRQMISRMKEITKLQKFKNINWLNNKTGRCAALYYTYKTACAACVGCRPGNTDCAVARAMAACWVVCLAGRRAYDSTGCPAGPGHATAQRDVGLAMTKCLGVTLEPRCVGVGGQ
jgi:RHS repeat-associated protein